MGNELKPCPFCDGETYVVDNGHGSYCIECYGCLAGTRYYDTKSEATKAWNTRAERTCRNVLDEGSFGCSVCGCHVRNLPLGSTYVSDGKRWYSTEKRTFNYCPHCGAKVASE